MNSRRVHNSRTFNLWDISVKIRGENLVLGSAGSSSLYCNSRGDYSFIYSIIANYWTDSFRINAALSIDIGNFDAPGKPLVKADFINCIIDGNNEMELSLTNGGFDTSNYLFRNCLMKFEIDL